MFKIFLTKSSTFDNYASDKFNDIMDRGKQLNEEFIVYFNNIVVGECIGSNHTWILLNSDFYEKLK